MAAMVPNEDEPEASSDGTRDDVVNCRLDQDPAVTAWQIERIKAGLAAGDAGQTRLASAVFGDIAAHHGW